MKDTEKELAQCLMKLMKIYLFDTDDKGEPQTSTKIITETWIEASIVLNEYKIKLQNDRREHS